MHILLFHVPPGMCIITSVYMKSVLCAFRHWLVLMDAAQVLVLLRLMKEWV